MKGYKYIFLYLFCIILTSTVTVSCSDKGPYNPYLHTKKKDKPSQNVGPTKKELKKAKKAYRKQLRASRKKVFGRKVAPK